MKTLLAIALFVSASLGQIVVKPISSYPTTPLKNELMLISQDTPTTPVVYKKFTAASLRQWIDSSNFDSAGCAGTLNCDSTGNGKLVRQHSPTITGTLTTDTINLNENIQFKGGNSRIIGKTGPTSSAVMQADSSSTHPAAIGLNPNNYGTLGINGTATYNTGKTSQAAHIFYTYVGTSLVQQLKIDSETTTVKGKLQSNGDASFLGNVQLGPSTIINPDGTPLTTFAPVLVGPNTGFGIHPGPTTGNPGYTFVAGGQDSASTHGANSWWYGTSNSYCSGCEEDTLGPASSAHKYFFDAQNSNLVYDYEASNLSETHNLESVTWNDFTAGVPWLGYSSGESAQLTAEAPTIQIGAGNWVNSASITIGENGDGSSTTNALGQWIFNTEGGFSLPLLATGQAALITMDGSGNLTLARNIIGPSSSGSSSVPEGDTGSFVGTLTGVTGTHTGTFTWSRNAYQVTISLDTGFTGTTNSTSMTITGLPSELEPGHSELVNCRMYTTSSTQPTGYADFEPSTSSVAFFVATTYGAIPSSTGWASTVIVKGVPAQTWTYNLQ